MAVVDVELLVVQGFQPLCLECIRLILELIVLRIELLLLNWWPQDIVLWLSWCLWGCRGTSLWYSHFRCWWLWGSLFILVFYEVSLVLTQAFNQHLTWLHWLLFLEFLVIVGLFRNIFVWSVLTFRDLISKIWFSEILIHFKSLFMNVVWIIFIVSFWTQPIANLFH